ncbi:MAG: 4-alpha-glucanotransferase, partial [Myxococcota bacterium]
RTLDDAQVARYSEVIEVIMQIAANGGRERSDIIAEVLSTLPYPLRRVLERYGLGRFRVTQKANLNDPTDVYRSENAEPPDWIMLGNHDTKPMWLLADEWRQSGALAAQAAYLARRLGQGPRVTALEHQLVADRGAFVHAKFADLLLSRAENVMVFFADLFGLREIYNAPGTVSPDNWSLRLTSDFAARYGELAPRLGALNLPYALAMALRALPGVGEHGDVSDLADQLVPTRL